VENNLSEKYIGGHKLLHTVLGVTYGRWVYEGSGPGERKSSSVVYIRIYHVIILATSSVPSPCSCVGFWYRLLSMRSRWMETPLPGRA
jgi:hypothetical protein